MILLYGQANYGKVDRVSDRFHVCTRFFHVYYIPLLPLRSYLVSGEAADESDFRGIEVPLSLKSVLAGWVRAVLVLVLVLGVGSSLASLLEVCVSNRAKLDLTARVCADLGRLRRRPGLRFGGCCRAGRNVPRLAARLGLEEVPAPKEEQRLPRQVSVSLASTRLVGEGNRDRYNPSCFAQGLYFKARRCWVDENDGEDRAEGQADGGWAEDAGDAAGTAGTLGPVTVD